MDLIKNLPQNILININLLKQDFLGFNIDYFVFLNFAVNLIISLIIIFASFTFGKKMFEIFKLNDEHKSYNYLIYIAFGFIGISTGVGVLGILSLLKPIAISLYLILIFVFSFGFPFELKNNFILFGKYILNSINLVKKNIFVTIWLILFIFIALINLINPEIREDQYHVDFSRIYLNNQSILIPPREEIKVSASPMLSEMYYMLGIFLYSKETTRYIHFIFYILTILTLIEFSKLKKYRFAIFTPLLFVSAPEVIHEASSAYTDFEWIFCFLLSLLVLIDFKESVKKYLISGILFGGVLATKLWTIVFSAVEIIFLCLKKNNKTKNIIIFTFFVLVSSIIWYLRAYILTGSFLYPGFTKDQAILGKSFSKTLSVYIGLNSAFLNPITFINIFSPLFFAGVILFLYKLKENIKLLLTLQIFKYLLILFILYLVIDYQFGRYLFGLYVVIIFFASIGLYNIYGKFKYAKYILSVLLIIVFSYYLLRSSLVLPYALGMANKNNYLSRVLVRDNSSYYNFGNKFEKYITKNDLVAMYNFHGYYYADFNYIDTNYIFDKPNLTFDSLKKRGVTKILIRSGNITWFCKNLNLSECTANKYILISSYKVFPFYYLYSIK